MTVSAAGVLRLAMGAIYRKLGLPATTKPATAAGIFNSTITAAATAEKILSVFSDTTSRKDRRCFIYNPGAGHLSYTTVENGSGVTPTTMTATAAGGNLDGLPVPTGQMVEVIVPWNAELWLAASANGARYQLTVSEGE